MRVLILIFPKAKSPGSSIDAGRKENLKVRFLRYLQRNGAKQLTPAIPYVKDVTTTRLVLVASAGTHTSRPHSCSPFLTPCPFKQQQQPPGWVSGAAPAPPSMVSHVETTSQGGGPGPPAEAGDGRTGQSRPGRRDWGRQNSLHRAGLGTRSPSQAERQVRSPCACFHLSETTPRVLPGKGHSQPTDTHAQQSRPHTLRGRTTYSLGKTNMAAEYFKSLTWH